MVSLPIKLLIIFSDLGLVYLQVIFDLKPGGFPTVWCYNHIADVWVYTPTNSFLIKGLMQPLSYYHILVTNSNVGHHYLEGTCWITES